jgi:hypothetical protein
MVTGPIAVTLAIAIDEELANAVGADRGDGDGLHDANLIANKVAFWRKADMPFCTAYVCF